MKKNRFLLLFLFIFVLAGLLPAQTNDNDPAMISSQFDMSGFPQWTRDLRRGEIVAFGSFPFMYFFSNFAIDIYRCANNGWDRRYAPWPFDAAGSIGKNQDERILTLSVAAGSAIVVALVDYGIERYKRSKKEREIRELPEGTPIIIQRPLNEEDGIDKSPKINLPETNSIYSEFPDTAAMPGESQQDNAGSP